MIDFRFSFTILVLENPERVIFINDWAKPIEKLTNNQALKGIN
jgi:hypothetical protein